MCVQWSFGRLSARFPCEFYAHKGLRYGFCDLLRPSDQLYHSAVVSVAVTVTAGVAVSATVAVSSGVAVGVTTTIWV